MQPLLLKGRGYRSYLHPFEVSFNSGTTLILGTVRDNQKASSNGCLVGSTLIDCPRDLEKYPSGIPIEDLVGTTPWVYAWKNGALTLCQASRVFQTKVSPTVRVNVRPYAISHKRGYGKKALYSPPLYLEGTADHRVLLSDGITWRALGELKPGDSICSMYRNIHKRVTRKNHGLHHESVLYWTGHQEWIREHRFVVEQLYGPRGPEYHAHHLNENSLDQSVENLEWKTAKEHISEHTSARNLAGTAGWKVSGVHPRGMLGKHHTEEKKAQIGSTMRSLYASGKRARVNHTVTSIEHQPTPQPVYDITVPDAGNFIANGMVVHNSGKSSLMLALCVLLFGEEPNGGTKDDLINDEADEYDLVGVFGEGDRKPKDSRNLVIHRSKIRNKSEQLEFWAPGGVHFGGNLPVVQAELLNTIGITKEMFCCSIFVSRTARAGQIMRALPTRRAELLEQLVADSRIQVAEQRAKAGAATIEAEIRSIESDLRDVATKEEQTRHYLDRLHEQIRTGTEQKEQFQRTRAQRINAHYTQLNELQAKYYDGIDLEPVTEKMTSLHSQLDSLRQQAALRKVLVGDARDLTGMGACPSCHRPLTPEVVKAQQQSRQAALIELKQMGEKEAKLKAELEECQRAFNNAQANQQANSQLARTIQQKQAEIRAAEAEEAPDFTTGFLQLRAEQESTLRVLAEQRQRFERFLLERGVRLDEFRFWVDGFGRQGLRNLMLDKVRVMMAYYSHHHLFQLAGDSMRLDFPQAVQSGSGKIREKFEIYITMNEHARELHMLSDGEAWKADFAVSLGLGDALMHGTNSLLKFRIIDDPVGPLDPVGEREFLLACEQLSKHYPVFITVPDEPEVEIPATIIRVVKHGAFSSLEAA